MVTSIGFEILEYSLEHQLPNFSECWWDHVSVVQEESVLNLTSFVSGFSMQFSAMVLVFISE